MSSGKYDFVNTTVCTFRPKLTVVKADYSDPALLSGGIVTETQDSGVPDVDGPAASSALVSITNLLFYGQGGYGDNIMGQQLSALIDDVSQQDTILSAIVSACREIQLHVDDFAGKLRPRSH